MRPIFSLALKDLLLMWRDKVGLFFIVGFPVLMSLFFGVFMGGMGPGGTASSMRIAVVDLDGSDFAAEYARTLDAKDGVVVVAMGRDEAREKVRVGGREGLVAYIVLPKGFGDTLGGLLGSPEHPVEMAIDPSRKAEAGFLQGLLAQSAFESLLDRFKDMGFMRDLTRRGLEELRDDTSLSAGNRAVMSTLMGAVLVFYDQVDPEFYSSGAIFGAAPAPAATPPATADVATTSTTTSAQPATVASASPLLHAGTIFSPALEQVARDRRGKPRSGWDITFPSGILWGVIACAAGFAVSIVVERSGGTMQRLRMSSLGYPHILAGKALACSLTILALTTFLLALAIGAFGVRVASYPLLVVAILSTTACFVGAMMLVAVFGRTEASVGGAGWALFLIWSMTGGGMIPLIAMPPVMVTISHFSPVKWAIYALEGAIWRDFTAAQMLTPCLILVATGVAFFLVGVLIFRRNE